MKKSHRLSSIFPISPPQGGSGGAWVLICILLASPFLLYAVTLLQPVHDDWSYFTTPYYDFGDDFTARLKPYFSYWRPFDSLFGYVLSLAPGLFPTLNHIAVYLAHLASTFIVYRLCQTFSFSAFARNVATIFFFISPAMLGTVLGIETTDKVVHLHTARKTYTYDVNMGCVSVREYSNRFVAVFETQDSRDSFTFYKRAPFSSFSDGQFSSDDIARFSAFRPEYIAE